MSIEKTGGHRPASTRIRPILPCVDDVVPSICGQADGGAGMLGFLEELGSPFMFPRIGREIKTAQRAIADTSRAIDVTRGETFPGPVGGSVAGGRYLLRDTASGGRILGAINITIIRRGSGKEQTIISNIVVDPAFRRQGIASKLVEAVVADHPRARLDANMTDDGAALFGYAGPKQANAGRRARP